MEPRTNNLMRRLGLLLIPLWLFLLGTQTASALFLIEENSRQELSEFKGKLSSGEFSPQRQSSTKEARKIVGKLWWVEPYSPFGEQLPDWGKKRLNWWGAGRHRHHKGCPHWWKRHKRGRKHKATTFTFTGLLRERIPNDDDQIYSAQFRSYRPGLGRWLTTDPAGFPDGMNRYAYVRNNPLSFVDPSGRVALFPLLLGGGAVVYVGLEAYTFFSGNETLFGYTQQERIDALLLLGLGFVALNGTPIAVNAVSGLAAGTYCARTLLGLALPAAALGPTAQYISGLKVGSDFIYEFQTSKGVVDVLARVNVSGKTLILEDIAVYSRQSAPLTGVTKGILKGLNTIGQAAYQVGFDKLQIIGQRTAGSTSANPLHNVNVIRDLTAKYGAR